MSLPVLINVCKPINLQVLQRLCDVNKFVDDGVQEKESCEKQTGWGISSEQKCENYQVSTLCLCGEGVLYWTRSRKQK